MEARDLMIGDWVHSKLHDMDSTVISIETDRYDYTVKEPVKTDDVWLESKKCWERHYMNEIEPIPLTKDILEKNGFEETIAYQFYDDLYFIRIIFWYTDKIELLIKSREGRCGYGELRKIICNVNELQHALRLFGIEKDIVV